MSGYIAASLSALCNGSFAALSKLPAVRDSKVNPIIFNTYVSLGVFLSSFLVIPFLQFNATFADKDDAGTSFGFEPLGLVAGFLIVCAFTFSFLAIPLVGLSIGQGVWGGMAIIVSFVGGLIVGQSSVKSALIILALALLLTGVIGIAFCGELTSKLWLPCFQDNKSDYLIENKQKDAPEDDPESDSYEAIEEDSASINHGASQQMLGITFALVVGLAGGSILVPMQYVSDAHSGLVFVPSLGIGAGFFSLFVPLIYFTANGEIKDMTIEDLKLKSCLLPGILAGTIWNLGNVASIWAIPRLGYSVAYPMMQCALLVSGCWGVFVFREIQHPKTIAILFISGAILLAGAAVLSVSVTTN